MHRLMMTSSAYRQVSTVSADSKRIDPDNLFFRACRCGAWTQKV